MTTNRFLPNFSFISGITNSQYAVATFNAPHSFVLNEIVSFRVSSQNGMTQMNNLQAKVLDLDTSTITVDIDSTSFNPFVTPSSFVASPALCVPVGSGIDDSDLFLVSTILDDAFDNVRV
jgi:hypothetical protein